MAARVKVLSQRWLTRPLNRRPVDIAALHSNNVRIAAHAYKRVPYTPRLQDTFHMARRESNDANAWSEFMVIEAHRSSSD